VKVGANISHFWRRVGNAIGSPGIVVVVAVVMLLEDMELLEVPLANWIPIRRTGGTLMSNKGLGAAFSWHDDLTANC
jgi:hypothetical protein